jgi:hypothetical protein
MSKKLALFEIFSEYCNCYYNIFVKPKQHVHDQYI